MVWAVASTLSPLVGGAFTAKVSWRWCFYVNCKESYHHSYKNDIITQVDPVVPISGTAMFILALLL